MREVEKAGLLGSHCNFLLEFVAGLAEVSLDTAANCTKPGDQQRKHDEHGIVREILDGDVKAVTRIGKEEIKCQT